MPTFDEIIFQLESIFKTLMDKKLVEKKNARLLQKEGIYVFYEGLKPIYVGRSRNIPERIKSHSRSSSDHNSASFAFLLAKNKARNAGINISATRGSLAKNSSFAKIYSEQKNRVANMRIKAVEIKDPETQAIFEIYASKKFKTDNDFNTH